MQPVHADFGIPQGRNRNAGVRHSLPNARAYASVSCPADSVGDLCVSTLHLDRETDPQPRPAARARAPVTPEWDVVEYRGINGLDQLEPEWHRLLATMPDHAPHHTFEVHRAYFRHVSRAEGQFTCLALTDGQRVRAICPLEPNTIEIFGLQTSVWGLPWRSYDLGRDVICPPDEAEHRLLPCVVNFLRRAPSRPRWLVFGDVLESSALWRCLRSLDSRAFATDLAGTSHVLDCARPYEEFVCTLSRNFRGNLRKARNKLTALSEVHFVNTSDLAGLEREFGTFLEVESSGWKGDASVRGAIRLKPDQLAFYRELVASRGDSRCEINALYAEGRCIASQLCFRTDATYMIPKIGYDESYARVAPGQVLLEWTLKRCCEDPLVSHLSLVSDAAWHRDWRPDRVPMRSVYVGLGLWSGRPLVRLLKLRLKYGPRVKRWLQRMHALPHAAR